MLIVFVATPITHIAAFAGTLRGVCKLMMLIGAVVGGALNLLAVPLTGKRAAVPVAQLVPVPVWIAYVPEVVVVVCTMISVT